MRQVFKILIGLAILVLGMALFSKMGSSKEEPEKKVEKVIKSVYVEIVKNTNVPVSITTSGSLLAKDRMSIFSEVTGVFLPPSKAFKAGTKYSRGETLIKINNEEFKASVISQRSSFRNLITSILPDVKFDYPDEFNKWEAYLKSINIQMNLPDLPKVETDKENNFITSRNIFSTFYQIRNLETRLKKYTISAPYRGVLTAVNITPGSIVSPGQKLGEFIKPNVFEIELNVNASLQDLLQVGRSVNLTKIGKTDIYTGRVIRVNPQIDRASQTIKIFVELVSQELKEGAYLEAKIEANEIEDALEIPRALLNSDNTIYVVRNNALKAIPVDVVHSNTNTVVIKGVSSGEQYVSKPLLGAFEGMTVKIIE